MTDGLPLVNYNISDFKLEKILASNASRKTITLLGSFPKTSETKQAIILFEKTAFSDKIVDPSEERTIFTELKVEKDFINNVYGSFLVFPLVDLNGIKATIIYPASQKHIDKYSTHDSFIVSETPDLYKEITEPHIRKGQFNLDWVYNILEHKEESDRIIFEDSDPDFGFILLPDLKWDGRTVENLYLLAIARKKNIRSIRDLDQSHLNLLKNIRDAGSQAIENRYSLSRLKLRIYFHYQPSFYHLHVHFNILGNDSPGIYCEKSHLIDTVINNIELMPDFYKKATLPFVLHDGDKLLDEFNKELCSKKKLKLSE